MSDSTLTLVSKATNATDNAISEGSEFGQSPLSAEAVAKSLLQKFAKKKHPAASELQWLVSFQDAPQSLLPLPETVAVSPDDALYDREDVACPPHRRVSLPVRNRSVKSRVIYVWNVVVVVVVAAAAAAAAAAARELERAARVRACVRVCVYIL